MSGHIDLLNVHAVLGKEPFFLRNPKRANPSADISVADDDFRCRDKESRREDDAKYKSYCEVEFFHRKHPSSDWLRLKKPRNILSPHIPGKGEDKCKMAWG